MHPGRSCPGRGGSAGVPLATILVSVAVVCTTYLAGKFIYRLRDVVLLMMSGGFIALILNPLVLSGRTRSAGVNSRACPESGDQPR